MLSSTFPLLSIQLCFPRNTGTRVAQQVFSHAAKKITQILLRQCCEPFSPPPARWQRLPGGDGKAVVRWKCDCCGSNVREMCESKARSALLPLRAVLVDAFALPAANPCQFAPAEHLGHEFCVLRAYKMFCVLLCSACKKKKDCIGAIRRMSSSNMLNKYCALFMRL